MKHSIKFLFKYMKKRWLILGYGALLLECLTPVVAAFYQKNLIDVVFIDNQYNQFPWLIALYGLFFFGPRLWFTVRRVTFNHIKYHVQEALTHQFILKLYALPQRIFNEQHVGQLLNHIRTDVNDACEIGVNKLLSEAMKSCLYIIALSLVLMVINMTLFLIVLLVALVYYLLLHVLGAKTKYYAQRVREEKNRVSINIEESISAVREIVAFNRQQWQSDWFEACFSDYYQTIVKESMFKARTILCSEPFLYGTKIIVIVIGGINIINHQLTLGAFVISFTLVEQLVNELGMLFQHALEGKRLDAAVQAIEVILNKEEKYVGKLFLDEYIQSISFRDVTFSYKSNQTPVLRHLSLNLPIGKKIAFVGESGSGKSTIAQLLIKAYEVDEGGIYINEHPINEYNGSYLNRVGIVHQEPYFLPISIGENLMFDDNYDESILESICKNMQCYDFIHEFPEGYQTVVGERGSSLSGGQKQRLALARSLLKDPELLILDEATSALDMETERVVQGHIDQLRQGKTTVIIAHRISTIQNADIIYVLDKGRISAQGTHDVLLKESSYYRNLYASHLSQSM